MAGSGPGGSGCRGPPPHMTNLLPGLKNRMDILVISRGDFQPRKKGYRFESHCSQSICAGILDDDTERRRANMNDISPSQKVPLDESS